MGKTSNSSGLFSSPLPDIIISGLLFLFFFQMQSDFIASVYAFGLLKTSLTIEIASVVFLLSPVILLILPLRSHRASLKIIGFLVVISCILEINLDTRGKMLVAGFGTGCFLIYFVLSLLPRVNHFAVTRALIHASGMSIALVLSILMRVPGSGNDSPAIAATPFSWWLLGLLAIVALVLAREPVGELFQATVSDTLKTGLFRLTILSLGISGVFILVYFAFFAPNVIARWTGANYLLVMLLPITSLALIGSLAVFTRRFWSWITQPVILAWNAIFIFSLTATIALNQVALPAIPSGFPLAEPPSSPLSQVPLIASLVLFPILFVDLALFTREIMTSNPTRKALAASFSLACLFLLVMVFAQVFTTVYDYIPFIGPLFRDKFWLVFLVAGLAAGLPVLLVHRPQFVFLPPLVKPGVIILAVFCPADTGGWRRFADGIRCSGCVPCSNIPPYPDLQHSAGIQRRWAAQSGWPAWAHPGSQPQWER